MKDSLTPKQVAQAIGMGESTVKRWCDQGLIPTESTPGKHRRLPLKGVIQFLRDYGHAMVKPELLGLPSLTGMSEALISRAVDDMRLALESGDDTRFRRHVLNLYFSKKSVCEICDWAITPAFHGIGDRWAHGTVDVYQERRACEICARALTELRGLIPAIPLSAPLAIGGTLSGDLYTLPTKIVELVLREAGWNAQNLGTNLPSESVSAALRSLRPRILWLSVAHIHDVEAFLRQYEPIYATAQAQGAAVVLGGNALTPDIRKSIQYAAYCDSFSHIVSFAASLSQ